ncbi:MAG: hypothetical protein ABFS34_06850 [Gemmatimonadota bacterium]
MSTIALRPRSVGEILDGAFQLYRSKFVALVLVAAVGSAPISIASSALMGLGGDVGSATVIIVGLLSLAALIPLALVYGALTYATARAAEGHEFRVGEAYARSVRAFPALVGAGILSIFVGMLALLTGVAAGAVIALPFAGLGLLFGGGSAVAEGILFFSAFFIGMFLGPALAAIWLFAVLPVIVVERRGPIAGVVRSFELSRGGRFKIFGVFSIALMIVALPGMALSMMFLTPAALMDPAASASLPAMTVALSSLGNFVASVLTTPYLIACVVLLYFDRRVGTEALDLERAVESLAEPA